LFRLRRNGQRFQSFKRFDSEIIERRETMPRSNSRGGSNRGRNNNPSGRNQYSGDWGVTELVRERPLAAAAAAAGAAAAGLFLWSRRAQISNQLSNLSDQLGDWSENMNWSSSDDGTGGFASSGQSSGSGRSSRSGMSETGGGNSSLGASSGGGGSTGSASGRGRAKSIPTAQQ
jgi:hypothetical protein